MIENKNKSAGLIMVVALRPRGDVVWTRIHGFAGCSLRTAAVILQG